jgi:hypothetical protein
MTVGVTIVLVLIALSAISAFVPKAHEGVLSFYNAGLLALYLVILAYGAIRVAEGEETGWVIIVAVAGFFGHRMHKVLNRDR